VRLLEENVATFENGDGLRSPVLSLRAAPLRPRTSRQAKLPRNRED
jgi:hypothetical protein